MKAVTTDWTIVLAGSWNLAILNPDWFAKEIFGVAEIQVELVVENLKVQMKYTSGNVVVVPQPDQIIFGARHANAESLSAIEAAALKVLDRLPVTPLSAIGVNFTYLETEVPGALAALFDIDDSHKLADNNIEIKGRSIARELDHSGRTINYAMRQGTNGDVTFSFNFHTDVANAGQAVIALQNKTIEDERFCQHLLSKLYDVEMDQEPRG